MDTDDCKNPECPSKEKPRCGSLNDHMLTLKKLSLQMRRILPFKLQALAVCKEKETGSQHNWLSQVFSFVFQSIGFFRDILGHKTWHSFQQITLSVILYRKSYVVAKREKFELQWVIFFMTVKAAH